MYVYWQAASVIALVSILDGVSFLTRQGLEPYPDLSIVCAHVRLVGVNNAK